MVQRSRELLNWSRCVSWLIATADQILQWTWKKKMSRIEGSFQSCSKTRSTLYKFIWFLHLPTKTARRCTSKFKVKKFTDAEKFVGSRRQCSTYFKWVSSRLVTSSRGLPEIVLGTQSRKAFGDFGERSKPRRTEKGEKKLELRLRLNCPLNQRRSISINQSFLCPLSSRSELKYLSSIEKTELSYFG